MHHAWTTSECLWHCLINAKQAGLGADGSCMQDQRMDCHNKKVPLPTGSLANAASAAADSPCAFATPQVLGHSKTILVLLGGWAFLGDQISGRQFAGMVLAVLGMVGYGVASSQ
jgi:hypothetical protein